MRRSVSAALTAALLLAPTALLAQDVLPRPLNAQENLKFLSGGNVVADWWKSVLIGPYTGTITSGNPTIPQITLYCVDFSHEVSAGQTWTANVTDLGSATSDASLGDTRLLNTPLSSGGDNPALTGDSFARYSQAAYLASLFSSWSDYATGGADPLTYSGGSFATQQDVYSGISAAIWTIMTYGFPGSFGGEITNTALAAAMAAPFVTMAQTNYANFDLSGWSILTDAAVVNGQPGTQEFLVRTTVTPEPQTYLLLLSGLIVVFAVSWWRRRESIEVA
jgi:hypothetical protein